MCFHYFLILRQAINNQLAASAINIYASGRNCLNRCRRQSDPQRSPALNKICGKSDYIRLSIRGPSTPSPLSLADFGFDLFVYLDAICPATPLN